MPLTLPADLQTGAACVAAFGMGIAAVLAFLDRREQVLKAKIEANQDERFKELEARISKLEAKHEEARGLAFDGMVQTSEPKARDLFTRIAKVLD